MVKAILLAAWPWRINRSMNIITPKLIARLNHRLRPVTDARIATCSHIVDQPVLSRECLGDDAFEEALQERRAWLAENLAGVHHGEPVRDSEGVITGRRFFFADPNDAFSFRIRF